MGLLKCAFIFFFFFHHLSSIFLILLLHMCKVQSSNLISSAGVQTLAPLCNCATSLQGEDLGGNTRKILKKIPTAQDLAQAYIPLV